MSGQDQKVKEIASNVVDSLAKIEESFRLAKLELLKQESALFRPLYQKREKLTSAIPRFWSTVLSIEDELAPFIKEPEADLLKSCQLLRVERLDDPRDFSLTMRFSENVYLEDKEVVKNFKFDGGRLTSKDIKLQWKQGKDLVSKAAAEDRLSFFSLFSFVGTREDEDTDMDDEDDPQLIMEDMAMLLADEVYPHALSYFTDALAPPDTPAESPFLGARSSGVNTPYMALESMTTSFLDQQELTAKSPQTVDVSSGKSQYLSKNKSQVEQYAAGISSPLPAFLSKHRQESIDAFNEVKMVTVNEAQFLMFLVRSLGTKSVLEIGCFTGFSAMCMAHAGASDIVTLEIDAELGSFAKLGIHSAGLNESIRVVVGDAHTSIVDRNVVQGPFDLIFIDAEKPGYIAYLTTILQKKLLAPRGIIIADNTLRRGCVAESTLPARHYTSETTEQKLLNDDFEAGVIAIKAFNEFVKSREELEQVLVPVYDGITLMRYKA